MKIICPNCLNELITDEASVSDTNCNKCNAKISFIPTYLNTPPETDIDAKSAFSGIIIVIAIIGAIGACMLKAGWNAWATIALTGAMIYLTERLFLSKYSIAKIEDEPTLEIANISESKGGKEFNDLVNLAIGELPVKFKNKLKDINLVIEDMPEETTAKNLGLKSRKNLAGLFHGIPLTHKSVWHGSRLPDKITIFKENIERYCSSDAQLKREVKRVVWHELGHFFGLNEEELRRIESRNYHHE